MLNTLSRSVKAKNSEYPFRSPLRVRVFFPNVNSKPSWSYPTQKNFGQPKKKIQEQSEKRATSMEHLLPKEKLSTSRCAKNYEIISTLFVLYLDKYTPTRKIIHLLTKRHIKYITSSSKATIWQSNTWRLKLLNTAS